MSWIGGPLLFLVFLYSFLGSSLKGKEFEFSCVLVELEPLGFPCRPLPAELISLLLAVSPSSVRNQEMRYTCSCSLQSQCSPGVIFFPKFLFSLYFLPHFSLIFLLVFVFPICSLFLLVSAIFRLLPACNRSFPLGQQALNALLVFLQLPFISLFISTPRSIFFSL